MAAVFIERRTLLSGSSLNLEVSRIWVCWAILTCFVLVFNFGYLVKSSYLHIVILHIFVTENYVLKTDLYLNCLEVFLKYRGFLKFVFILFS